MRHFHRRRRIFLMLLLIALAFVFLAGKLFYLQVIKGHELAAGAVRQRTQSLVLSEGRGDIRDRRGSSLLDSRRQSGLAVFPGQYRGRENEMAAFFYALQDDLDTPAPDTPFWIELGTPGYDQHETALPPGVLPALKEVRYGPALLASHVIGYLQESEKRGVSGIESAFDRELSKGQETALAAPVDGKGRMIPGLGYSLRGGKTQAEHVTLTLDAGLQQEVEAIMDRRMISGAVVVMDPRQGDILAMASRPNFHPGRVGEYLQSEGALLNRAVLAYQPGSVFKTVIAAAALEEGLAGMYSEFTCAGGVEVEGLFIPCSQLHPRSRLTLLEALTYSCNSVFIRLALELGPAKVYRYARQFGLGEMTGLPVGETAGYLPAENEMSWSRNLANIAIGQGDLLVTPLQAAVMMAAVANGGTRVQPRLVLSIVDERGRITRRFPARRKELFLSYATVNRLKYMLGAVVAEGTGKRAALTAALSGAKTGTAQSGRRRDGGQEILNYWIAGFYPLENARAVIVVFADQMKEGTVSQVFGEIALYLENN